MRPSRILVFGLLGAPFILFPQGCNLSEAVPELPEWTLERELTIGSVDDSEQALTVVGAVTVDGDGNMYVSQPNDHWVRVFSPDGAFLFDIGRGGQGPGEFQRMWRIGWLGDTLWVAEGRAPKVNFYEKDGTFLHSVRLSREPIDGKFRPGTGR